MRLLVRGVFWFGAYVAFLVLPLAIAFGTDAMPQPRSWLLEFCMAIGFIAFTIMAFEFALVGRLQTAQPSHSASMRSCSSTGKWASQRLCLCLCTLLRSQARNSPGPRSIRWAATRAR